MERDAASRRNEEVGAHGRDENLHAGIPLLPEDETIAVQQGQAADLVFVLRASEGEFAERNPVPTRAVAYPLGQEAKTVPAQMRVRYLVPAGGSHALEKEELDMKHQSDSRETPDEPEDGLTKVVADVPAGGYVFQISARPPEGVDYWKVATYHFRVLVLPAE